MTDLSRETMIHRIARYLSGRAADAESIERAADLLALMKEPDAAMAERGDAAQWREMIDAALIERWSEPSALGAVYLDCPEGPDEEGETSLTRKAAHRDPPGAWVGGGKS